jgi:CheY-like chemotaxis protein
MTARERAALHAPEPGACGTFLFEGHLVTDSGGTTRIRPVAACRRFVDERSGRTVDEPLPVFSLTEAVMPSDLARFFDLLDRALEVRPLQITTIVRARWEGGPLQSWELTLSELAGRTGEVIGIGRAVNPTEMADADLRSQLHVVLGYAELLLAEPLGPGQSDLLHGLGEATSATRKLLALGDSPLETPFRVLSIDDDAATQALVDRIADRVPWVALSAAPNGRSGIRRLKELQPDVVLVDLNLPDLDGSEIVSAALALSPRPFVAVISADARPDRIADIQAAGVDAYVTKPFDIEVVLSLFGAARARSLRRGTTSNPPEPFPAVAAS